jgi:hypothetical protein
MKSLVVPVALALQAAVWAGGPAATAGPGISGAPLSPSLVLARYVSAPARSEPWDTVSVDIQASLPKLAKQGRLRAIRHVLPFGRAEYQVLETEGDRTVRQQVIARYLSAEVKAATLPSSAVAFTPANYKFRYAGSIETGGSLIYIYWIAPRKKRAGLIRGELWIDTRSGIMLRQSGRLVRNPSVFLRRVEVTRDITVHEGMLFSRVTHLNIDTRIVGRAELTITERRLANPEIALLSRAALQ